MGKPTKRVGSEPLKTPPIPAPFSPAPAELRPFLETLSESTVYITHLDVAPRSFKRRIFAVPVALNLTISILLFWRAYIQLPYYLLIIQSFFGEANESTIYFQGLSWGQLFWAIVKRGTTFVIDWILFRIVGPWPYTFFFESADKGGNPARWRWKVGFRDEEIYVRSSRGWGKEELVGREAKRKGEDSPFFRTKVLPALDKQRLREKTGYMLMDGDWDLEFAAMVEATELIDQGQVDLDMLRKSVFVYVGEGEHGNGQWVVWDCWKLDEGSETEARKKIVLFKDKLTAMGKENLFFKWVELVQYESSTPGGFTYERQRATAEKAKAMFEEQGIDFERFVREVGGLDGLPGMEKSGVTT